MKGLFVSVFFGAQLTAAMAQGELVINGGFERGFGGWLGTYGYIDHATFAFEGSHVRVVMNLAASSVGQKMHEILRTEPNRQYAFQFSLLSGAGRAGEQSPPGRSPVSVRWGNTALGQFSNPSVSTWESYDFGLTATVPTTELNFASLGNRYQLMCSLWPRRDC